MKRSILVASTALTALALAGCGGGNTLAVPSMATSKTSEALPSTSASLDDTSVALADGEALVERPDGSKIAQRPDGSFRVVDDAPLLDANGDPIPDPNIPSPTEEGYVMPGEAKNAKLLMSSWGVSYPSVGFPAQGAVDTAVAAFERLHSPAVTEDADVETAVARAGVDTYLSPELLGQLTALDRKSIPSQAMGDTSDPRVMLWWLAPGAACSGSSSTCSVGLNGNGYLVSNLNQVDERTVSFTLTGSYLWSNPDIPALNANPWPGNLNWILYSVAADVRAEFEQGRWVLTDLSNVNARTLDREEA